MINKLILFICFWVKLICATDQDVWKHQVWLDPYEKYSLKWNIDEKGQSITFLCEVQTKGWIGFGLSPNGGMKDSDLIIGWVDDNSGIAYFNDRYASDESLPQIDESQDWVLLESSQNSSHTTLKFSRPLNSCDEKYDRDITRDTIRLIYAYSDTDPKSELSFKKHGIHQRGSRSLLLLSQPDSKDNEPQEEDIKTLVLNVKNITIDNKETTYWCKIFKMPDEKVHVVKFLPYITPGNEPLLHHMTIDVCLHPNSHVLEKYIHDEGSDCSDTASMPKDFYHCFNPYIAWATGGGPFVLPKDVGFPLGGEDVHSFLMLNIHYHNPELIAGRLDSSGMQLEYTKSLRKQEAFTMVIGSNMDNRLFVPPKQNSFHITGHCDTKCFQNQIDQDGLNVFAIWPHAHLLARKIKTRHFRGNSELPWLEFDQNYDFNLQSFRSLNPMVKIKSGDHLTVECEYDSSEKNKTVLGGFATTDEMCVSFLYYYPRMVGSKPCLSGFTNETIRELAGIEDQKDLNLNNGLMEYIGDKQVWNQTVMDESHQIMLKSKQKLECYWIKTDADIDSGELIGYPTVDNIFEPEVKLCKSDDSHVVHAHFLNVVLIAIIAILIAIIIVVALIFFRKRDSRPHNRLI